MAEKFHLNQRLSYVGELCTVRFIGTVDGTKGEWLGVEWDDSLRGKHSGENNGKKYFECKIPGAGSFIRPKAAPEPSRSFLEALRYKYATTEDSKAPISLSTNKIFEEVGFEKINQKLARLKDLKIVLLDSLQIGRGDDVELIGETCPNIEDLNLSRNRLEKLQDVADICSVLPNLRSLRISGNRFSSWEVKDATPFEKITDLEIENLLPTWDEFTRLLALFSRITNLRATYNNFTHLPTNPFPSALKILDLGNNLLPTLSTVTPLCTLPDLHTLVLAHNTINTLILPPHTTFPHLQRLDISYNHIRTFSALDALSLAFPSLSNLRVAHNPLYAGHRSEEAHMLTIARLPANLHILNHSAVSVKERDNAELWYLSRIAAELAASGEARRHDVLKNHGRWAELCKLHGEPRAPVGRGMEDRTLKARLVELEMCRAGMVMKRSVPRSTPISTLRMLVGRWFGVEPLKVRLRCVQHGGDEEEGEEEEKDEIVLEDVDDTREVGMHFEKRNVRVIVESK